MTICELVGGKSIFPPNNTALLKDVDIIVQARVVDEFKNVRRERIGIIILAMDFIL